MLLPLDGPSKSYKLASVGTGTAVKIEKPTESPLDERKVVTIQPLDGSIRVYFAEEGVVPSAATVGSDGFRHFKNGLHSYEASDTQTLYIVSESGTTDVIVAERA